MIALCVGVGQMGGADAQNLGADFGIPIKGCLEGFPGVALAAPDDVVNRGQRKILVR